MASCGSAGVTVGVSISGLSEGLWAGLRAGNVIVPAGGIRFRQLPCVARPADAAPNRRWPCLVSIDTFPWPLAETKSALLLRGDPLRLEQTHRSRNQSIDADF